MLVCPRDRAPLERLDERLVCPSGHEYPVVHDVPVLVDPELPPTQGGYWSRPADVERVRAAPPQPTAPGEVDPYVTELLIGTHGNLYRGVGRVRRYPIPKFPLQPEAGKRLLDVGCNWGRWSLAAAKAGFDVTGADPSIEAAAVAARIARRLDVPVRYVAADARRLPFAHGAFDVVFSYSVLQHLPHGDVQMAIDEFARVLAPGGVALVQMANSRGLRSLYHQARRGFREAHDFEIRYWSLRELRSAFARIGDPSLAADGFFTLNPQAADLDLLPLRARAVVLASTGLRAVSRAVPPLASVADSLWVRVDRR